MEVVSAAFEKEITPTPEWIVLHINIKHIH